MSDDRRRIGQQASRRDEVLRRWIADEVHPYCPPVRRYLDRSGLGRRGVRGAADLARLPVIELAELGDGRGWVLEPTAERIREEGALALRARLLVADVLGRRDAFARQDVDLPYKPVAWTAAPHADGTLLIGSTTSDLERLAALGRRALAISGITAADRIVAWEADGVGTLQLELGARDAGVAHLRAIGDLGVVARTRATVLAGPPAALAAAVDGGLPDSVRLLIAHLGSAAGGPSLRDLRARAGRPLRLWWAPAGVRAAWVTCEADQLHSWPEHEHLEVVDDAGRPAESGRLVWSAVGWRGSVWLRVALGPHGRVARDECRCGRTTPRVLGAGRPARTGPAGRRR